MFTEMIIKLIGISLRQSSCIYISICETLLVFNLLRPEDTVHHRRFHGLYRLHLHPPADKVLVGAVMSAEALLLLHHSVSVGAARPHAEQYLQAAHGNRRVRRGQPHRVSHPAAVNT